MRSALTRAHLGWVLVALACSNEGVRLAPLAGDCEHGPEEVAVREYRGAWTRVVAASALATLARRGGLLGPDPLRRHHGKHSRGARGGTVVHGRIGAADQPPQSGRSQEVIAVILTPSIGLTASLIAILNGLVNWAKSPVGCALALAVGWGRRDGSTYEAVHRSIS